MNAQTNTRAQAQPEGATGLPYSMHLLLHLLLGLRLPGPLLQDMGGAALVLALAHVVMSHRLPVRLRVLVPAVENSISGNAYRPLDVLATRAGITVEVGVGAARGQGARV